VVAVQVADENLPDVVKPHPKPKKLVLRAFAAIHKVSFVLQRDELGRKIAPLKRAAGTVAEDGDLHGGFVGEGANWQVGKLAKGKLANLQAGKENRKTGYSVPFPEGKFAYLPFANLPLAFCQLANLSHTNYFYHYTKHHH